MTTTTTAITCEAFYPHPIERVWRVLTDSPTIERWLMENDFQPAVGHRFTFRTQPMPALDFDGIIHCEVTAVEPPRLLAHTWTNKTVDTVVTYRLERAQQNGVDGTRLRFEHAGFDLSKPADAAAYNGMAGGWRTMVATGLPALLDEAAA